MSGGALMLIYNFNINVHIYYSLFIGGVSNISTLVKMTKTHN